MDLVDLAEKETENYISNCRHQLKQPKKLPAIGVCYNCDETLEAGKVFCNTECREDYELRSKYKKR